MLGLEPLACSNPPSKRQLEGKRSPVSLFDLGGCCSELTTAARPRREMGVGVGGAAAGMGLRTSAALSAATALQDVLGLLVSPGHTQWKPQHGL